LLYGHKCCTCHPPINNQPRRQTADLISRFRPLPIATNSHINPPRYNHINIFKNIISFSRTFTWQNPNL
jgi:hypothetical protein